MPCCFPPHSVLQPFIPIGGASTNLPLALFDRYEHADSVEKEFVSLCLTSFRALLPNVIPQHVALLSFWQLDADPQYIICL